MTHFAFRGKKTSLKNGDFIILEGKKGGMQQVRFTREGESIMINDHDTVPVGKSFNILKDFQRICVLLAAVSNRAIGLPRYDERPKDVLYCYKVIH